MSVYPGEAAAGIRGADALLLAPADLRVRESDGIALPLLGRDPGEDAVEMLVLDDDAGSERRVILAPAAAATASTMCRAVGSSDTVRGQRGTGDSHPAHSVARLASISARRATTGWRRPDS